MLSESSLASLSALWTLSVLSGLSGLVWNPLPEAHSKGIEGADALAATQCATVRVSETGGLKSE